MLKKLEDLKFNVNEIFHSIQGEGSRIGLPFIFVRFQGCLLRCVWCDTPYALERKQIETIMSGKQILNKLKEIGCKNIMLTGGEPLEQEDIFDFITLLLDLDFNVVIETNGQVDTKRVDNRAIKVLDFKCPDSNMSKKNNFDNVNYLNFEDEVKFVIGSELDYNWSKDIIKKYDLNNKVNTILFSPVFGSLEPKQLAEWILHDKLNVRMQLQLHKFIWEPNTRGV